MNIKIETKVSAPFDKVKKAFVDREGKLLKYLLPLGAKILHYKGVRRGAILKIKLPFSGKLKFKIVTYKVTKLYLYFNDIIQEGKIFGAGFGREIPLLGHINCLLKLVISPFSII